MMTRLWNAMSGNRIPLAETSRRLMRDKRGVSAIEFVLLFPILIGMMAGTVDFGQALTVSRKMNQIASTLGDMTSQQGTWSAADIDAIMAGAATIIEPFNKNDLKIELAILDIDNALKAKVNWSRGYKTAALNKGDPSPVTIPTNIAQSGVQLIAVRARFSLTTPFSKLLKPVTGVTTYQYQKTYIMRPRTSETVTLN